jgi:hypothetical protein
MARTGSISVNGRAQPITAGDLSVAVLGAAYALGANQDWLWRTLTAWPTVNDATKLQVGRMADQLLQRYGDQQVSPGLAGFIGGMCQSYAGWHSEPVAHPERTAASFLNAVADECSDTAQPSSWTSTATERASAVCVLGNGSDPVAPASWAMGWQKVFPGAAVTVYQTPGHVGLSDALRATPQGIENCVK